MICAIMQPTYLPWSGFFNLIGNTDIFVFFDDAQFQKNSWHNRNRLLVNGIPHWITVPVRHFSLGQTLNDTLICEEKKWRRKHASFLCQNYARHPYKTAVEEISNYIEQDKSTNIASLNINIINYICLKLKIQTLQKKSSEILTEGRRTEKIINILKCLQATRYLSPVGASGYLEEDGFNMQNDIKLEFQSFEPYPYLQFDQEEFVPYLSIVDVVANLGWEETSEYVRQSTWRFVSNAK